MPHTPLSRPLSHLLVAFTVELDNELERRLAEADPGRHRRVSAVMWSNFLRFVGDGITVGELPVAAGVPKARMLSTLGGMERWRYVWVAPDGATAQPETRREGWGSARGLTGELVVRPTHVGRTAQELWPPLFREIEARWEERFGAGKVGELRRALSAVTTQLDLELPEYLPIVTGANGMAAEISPPERPGTTPTHLSALLPQVLLAYTLDFERDCELSLPLAENVVRVVGESGVDVRDIPAAAAVSREATSMALTFLQKHRYAVVRPGPDDSRAKFARLTPKGRAAREAASDRHAVVERDWEAQLGRETVRTLRATMQAVLAQRDGRHSRLALGLAPYPDGWRASGRYLRQTEAMLEDPHTGLPMYPLVLHRGGWPDGS